MKSQLIKCLLFILLISVISRVAWSDRVYSIVPFLNVREKPSNNSKIIEHLRYGRWVDVINKGDEWMKIKMPNGKNGYVFTKLVTDIRIRILKDERRLLLMKGDRVQQQYPAALGFNPRDDKIKQGDGCTPEGRFYICQIIEKPKTASTYGPVSLRISYPNIEDARRGLKDKLIKKTQYLEIVKAIHHGRMPLQNTPLGGSIKIHGGDPGVSYDWTLGCVAMKNSDIKQLFSRIPKTLVMVDIYRNRQQEQKYNGNGYVNRRTLEESQKLIKQGCSYTRKATAIIPISYPLGDFDKSIGVCTDVAIRALRGLGIDLQALLYEDIILHPRRYPNISKPNPNIDHRRTRNLKRFFDFHAEVLTIEPPAKKPKEWLPGDIVIMDTGIPNGTIYDHIGIVSSRKSREGIPLVINLWTIGCQLNEMELLNGDYPKIVGHYRLLHPFFYDALK
jgi:uncharacterized protein YijF (DUF1287 family)